jgi:hypothetical protein
VLQTERAKERATRELMEEQAGEAEAKRSNGTGIMPLGSGALNRGVGSRKEVAGPHKSSWPARAEGKNGFALPARSVSGNAKRGVMVKTPPASSFVVAESEFLF